MFRVFWAMKKLKKIKETIEFWCNLNAFDDDISWTLVFFNLNINSLKLFRLLFNRVNMLLKKSIKIFIKFFIIVNFFLIIFKFFIFIVITFTWFFKSRWFSMIWFKMIANFFWILIIIWIRLIVSNKSWMIFKISRRWESLNDLKDFYEILNEKKNF